MVGSAIQRLAPSIAPDYKICAPTRQELDLLDRGAVCDYIVNGQFDMIIHAGAKVGGIKANISDPVGFMTENILISTHVIEEARRANVPKLINLGSSCMYPRDYRNPLVEDDVLAAPLEPTNEGYAIAKIAAARLCQYISETDCRLSYRTFIPCNLYGVGDKYDLQNSHMIAAAIMKIHAAHNNGDTDVEIWGDGTVRREFVYVDDVAKFILTAEPKLTDMPPCLNIGLGRDYTVNEYYRMIADVIGFKGKFVYNLNAPVGMTHKLMDISKAEGFGWVPETNVLQGVRAAYDGFRG